MGLLALNSLVLALVFGLGVDNTLLLREFGLDFFFRRHGALHPGVFADLLDSEPVIWLKSHHLLKEILKLSAKDVLAILGLDLSLPEKVGATGGNHFVMRVLRVGRSKWRSSRHNGEQSDG